MFFYVLFGIGCYIGYYSGKTPSILDILEVLTWPVYLGALVVASLKRYLEIK